MLKRIRGRARNTPVRSSLEEFRGHTAKVPLICRDDSRQTACGDENLRREICNALVKFGHYFGVFRYESFL